MNMDWHVCEHSLPQPANESCFLRLVENLYDTGFDLEGNKPLWQFIIVNNYEGNKCAIIGRIHHSVGDGTTMIHVLFSLMDPVDPSMADKLLPSAPPRPKVNRTLTLWHPLEICRRLWMLASDTMYGMSLVGLPNDPPTPLKIPSSRSLCGHRKLALSNPIDLDRIRQVRAKTGASLNDILVATLAATIRAFLVEETARAQDCGVKAHRIPESVRAVFPLNTRIRAAPKLNEQYEEFGNQFVFVPLSLPISVSDPVEMLVTCKARCDNLKESPLSYVLQASNVLAGTLLPSCLATRVYEKVFNSFTCLFTNVPGPQVPVSICGRRMTKMMFFVTSMLGSTTSILSYNGKVYLGVCTDSKLIPNPKRQITDHFDAEFEKLHAAVMASDDGVFAQRRPTAWDGLIQVLLVVCAWVLLWHYLC
eukprot:Rmarinus@m.1606